MNEHKGINPKIVYWLTFSALLVSIFCLVIFLKGVSVSGDTAIAMWAIFLFSFILVSAPLHMLLFVMAFIQFFVGAKQSFKWVSAYLLISVVGHVLFAGKYGAFDDWLTPLPEQPQLTSAEVIMQQAFSQGISVDSIEVQKALDQGLDVNSGFYTGRLPYLVKAASYADVASIQALLAAGADPNKKATIEFSARHRVSINDASPLYQSA